MRRRRLLQTGLQSCLLPWLMPLMGHTPFPQWKVYRQRHLFIAIDRTDTTAYTLSHRLTEIFDRDLPEAEAKVTRAINAVGVASLMSTAQLDVALMQKTDAVAWSQGAAAFQAIAPVSLRTLVDLGDYLLICRDDFPNRHASVIAHTLTHALTENATAHALMHTAAHTAQQTAGVDPIQAIEIIPFHPGVPLNSQT
jgi:TRAP-type uncharacterized transport system substrate-binding protein